MAGAVGRWVSGYNRVRKGGTRELRVLHDPEAENYYHAASWGGALELRRIGFMNLFPTANSPDALQILFEAVLS